MIMLARSLSRRWTMWTVDAYFVRYDAFFHGRVAAADDDQRLVAEAGQGAVAHGAGTDAAILVCLFRRQAEVICPAPWRQ